MLKHSLLTMLRRVCLTVLMACVSLALYAQKSGSREIVGKVLDEEAMPLAGAAIVEKGTNNGTVADLDGNYSITTTTASPVLVFSFFGYGDEEIARPLKKSLCICLYPAIIF